MSSKLVNTHVAGDKHIQLWQAKRIGFEGKSTAHETYVGFQGQRPAELSQVARAVNVPIKQNSTFYGETTSRASYQAPPTGVTTRRESVTEQKYEPNQAKFYGSTTNAETYQYVGGKPAELSQTARQTSIPIQETSTFYDQTTTRSTFLPHQVVGTATVSAPNAKSLDGVLDAGRGEYSTTSQSAYVAFPVEKREAPRVVYEPNKAYFYGTTTTGETYKAWDVERPERVHAPVHEGTHSSGKFYGTTTNRETYLPHQVSRQAPCAPLDHLKNEGTFQGVTTNRELFKGWQLPTQRLSLGLETVNDSFFVMIPKNKPLPTEFTQCFTTVTDNQNTVEIVVRQGDSLRASENQVLGTFELVGIPPMPCGEPQVQVTFIINQFGVLHVDAKDRLTGKHHAIAIDKNKNSAAFAK